MEFCSDKGISILIDLLNLGTCSVSYCLNVRRLTRNIAVAGFVAGICV